MSRLKFRNVDVDPSDPVDQWPYEALTTAVERGSLSDWRRIAAELARRPWGRAAADLDEYFGYADESGATLLLKRALQRARAAAQAEDEAAIAEHVRELIVESRLSRAEFAARAGTSPSRLSTYCTGKVTPSATVLRRLERVAED